MHEETSGIAGMSGLLRDAPGRQLVVEIGDSHFR